MSTPELVVNCIILSLIAGALVGWSASEYLRVYTLRRKLEAERMRNVKMSLRVAGVNERHRGTPYLVSTRDEARRPGVRMVDGEPRYSSQWLNDEATA